jgi:hypothetical protein
MRYRKRGERGSLRHIVVGVGMKEDQLEEKERMGVSGQNSCRCQRLAIKLIVIKERRLDDDEDRNGRGSRSGVDSREFRRRLRDECNV